MIALFSILFKLSAYLGIAFGIFIVGTTLLSVILSIVAESIHFVLSFIDNFFLGGGKK